MEDVRWIQRLDSFNRALQLLTEAVDLAESRPLSDLERQGLIQGFEFTHELGWNLLKDYLESEGVFGVIGSKGATREAFRSGLIEDGEAWMKMIESRNLTSHTYNSDIAESVMEDVVTRFHPAFAALQQRFSELAASRKKET